MRAHLDFLSRLISIPDRIKDFLTKYQSPTNQVARGIGAIHLDGSQTRQDVDNGAGKYIAQLVRALVCVLLRSSTGPQQRVANREQTQLIVDLEDISEVSTLIYG